MEIENIENIAEDHQIKADCEQCKKDLRNEASFEFYKTKCRSWNCSSKINCLMESRVDDIAKESNVGPSDLENK